MAPKRTTRRATRVSTTDNGGTYLLRDIDRTLWAAFTRQADADGVKLRTVILQCVRGYVDGSIAVGVASVAKVGAR